MDCDLYDLEEYPNRLLTIEAILILKDEQSHILIFDFSLNHKKKTQGNSF